MKKIGSWKEFLMLIIVFFVFFFVNAAAAVAEQYYCDADYNICNVSRSTLTQTVGCMNTGDLWQCNLTSGNSVKCQASSKEKNPPKTDWYNAPRMCDNLCNACPGGWKQKQSGGSTY